MLANIQAFLVAIQEGSLRRAATRQPLSQSALSGLVANDNRNHSPEA
jgi:DNA-binding transcriptional LysR family regulator